MPGSLEFPRVDPRVIGQRHNQLYYNEAHDQGLRPGYNAVVRMDMDSGRVDRYSFGNDVMVEEHVFVPRPGGSGRETDGWLVGAALDLKRKQTMFTVFRCGPTERRADCGGSACRGRCRSASTATSCRPDRPCARGTGPRSRAGAAERASVRGMRTSASGRIAAIRN